MPVTQKQIAAELGVSWSLVTRALRDHPSVAPATRRRVQEAARRLGYTEHSNREARALIARRYGHRVKTSIIAVITPAHTGEPLHNAPFFSSLLDGIELGADKADLDIYLARYRESRSVPLLIQDRGVDGVICLQSNPAITDACAALDLTAVTLFDHGEGIHGIEPDQREGMRQAVKYLVELGHRRIAYLGHEPDFSSSFDRLEGYRAGLREHEIPEDDSLIEASLRAISWGPRGVDRILARTTNLTALVCYNDTIAMGAVRRLQERGFNVPQDISVIGFDDISTQYSFSPALTSIHFDGIAMGCRAVELLGELRDAPPLEADVPCWRHELLPVQLQIRDSVVPR